MFCRTSLLRLLSIGSLSFLLTISLPFIPYSPSYVPSLQVLAQSNDARKAEADRLLKQGIEQYQTSQFSAALQSWQQVLDIYQEIKDRKGEGSALGNLGVACLSMGDYPKAIDYHKQSLKIAQEIKNRKGQGNALANLGLAYWSMGDYPKAIDYQQRSLKIVQEIKDRQGEGKSLGNLGATYFRMGDYPKAIDYHKQSLKIFQEIKDRQGEGKSLGNLGLAYFRMGDYPKAIDYHKQSLKILQEIKDRQGEGKSLGNLGNAYSSMGDYPKAIEYYERTLKIAQETKDRQGEGNTLRNLGDYYSSMGEYLKAIDYQQQSLKIAQEIKDRQGEGQSLGNLSNTYWSMGDYPKAIEYDERRLKIAQEIKDRQGEGSALGNLGNVYFSMGDYPKAIDYQQRYLKIAQEIKDRKGEGTALNNLGLTYYKTGNLQLAESILFKSMEVWESLRGRLKDNNKITIFDTQSSTYRTLQQALIAQNKTNAALLIAERGRARAFVELLTAKLSSNPNKQLSTPPNIEQIKQTASAQNATLVQYSIIYDKFKGGGKSQVKESELYIWVIKPTGAIVFKQVDLKNINKSLQEIVISARDSMGVRGSNMFDVAVVTPSPQDPTQKLKQLHKLLIAPIADLLPKNPNERVIFIPQASLFTVPFPALLDEKGKYLIEKHTILTAPSIQVLGLTHQQKLRNSKLKVAGQNALVVGNPTMPKIQLGDLKINFSPLPGSEREANTVAKLLETQALIGDKANKAKVIEKMQNASTIHLATHGLLQDFKGFGVPGAIVVAPDSTPKDGINGLLTASEILDMKLRADLVVLSACDTGRGKITGDGVIGLSRSLITAGVPSVIVSLWKVNDNSTEFLMSEFYRNLLQNPDKAVALRQAMLTTMKQQRFSNPLRWAAFTLIGEAK
ncbi:MAG: tetratricopeptide repeat protein [Scytonematopsis contorta HA4267-MV1]|nr:tetratricopeptide repeat protein [Scytonematopsis contorta HA4267-MV1]